MAWISNLDTLFYVALFEGRNRDDTQRGQINPQLDDALLDAACAAYENCRLGDALRVFTSATYLT